MKYWSLSQWRRTSFRRSKSCLSLFRPWNRLFLFECIWCILVLTLPLAWLSQQSGELHGTHRVMRPCIVRQPPVSNCELVCSAEICFQLAAQIRSTISTHASAPRIIPSLLHESKKAQGRQTMPAPGSTSSALVRPSHYCCLSHGTRIFQGSSLHRCLPEFWTPRSYSDYRGSMLGFSNAILYILLTSK